MVDYDVKNGVCLGDEGRGNSVYSLLMNYITQGFFSVSAKNI